MRQLILLFVFSVAFWSTARGVSTVTDVTPSNIGDLSLKFRVEHEVYDNGTVKFSIFVASGAANISPRRTTRFVIWEEPVVVREGVFHSRSTRPKIIANCEVKEEAQSEVLSYVVEADRSMLKTVTFIFYNNEPNGMPAFDAYEFILAEFVNKQE